MDNNVEKIDLDRVDWKSSREFFESLGEALDKLDDKDESYNFTWVGKRKSIVEAGTPINKTLRPDVEASKNFDNTKNMLIVGDNLDALKLLQESYLGKIKMIYIDPPYNTGHDFVYHDDFIVKAGEYKDNSIDDNGNKLVSDEPLRENSRANGRFHSDWLSMMYPRLKLARNLLTNDGTIFISIDDNEQDNLKKLCNEIFGEDNFIAQVVWERAYSPVNLKKHFSECHDYILVYGKNKEAIEELTLKRSDEANSRYSNPDNDPRGPWKSGDFSVGPRVEANVYPITTPSGRIVLPPSGRCWRVSESKFKELVADNRVSFGENGDSVPSQKRFLSEVKQGMTPMTIWKYTEVGHSQDAAKRLKDLFGGRMYFEYSKPVGLIQRILELNTGADDIILDFFAGSGTTGHAVMQINKDDGGNRRYILVQLDEKVDEKSEAYKDGYNTIDKITNERLRRAEKIIDGDASNIGFRVFRIDSENENLDIRKPLGEISQSDLFGSIDNIKKDRTPLDLLFGVVYISALPFDLKLETRKIGENTVYLYGYLDEGTGLVACFDDNISEDTIKEIADMKSLTAAFKDSSFVDSAAKINLSEQFRVISPDTKVKVI